MTVALPESRPSHVLVVTPRDGVFDRVTDALGDAFVVEWARDGWVGLEKASDPRLDLIVTEIELPRLGAAEMIAGIREQPQLDGLPILVLSATGEDAARVALLRAGAQDYVVTPFAAEELRARAMTLAGVKRLRDILQYDALSRPAALEVLAREVLADKQRALQALSNAEASSAAKDEFLAVLSHELRTPLNAMLGWLAILQRTGLPEADRARALDVVTRNARAQARLVDDLLDVSAMIRGRVRLQMERVALRSVVGEAIDTARPAAEAKTIALHWHCDAAALVVDGDVDRLRQVVHNLLVNAIKFTPEGGHVMVRLDGDGGEIALSVEDSGIGIEPEFLPYVFERFAQATPGTTRTRRGLGLGLAIVRHIVEMHGGAVGATSPGPGKGSTFTVRLPVPGDKLHQRALPRATGAGALLGLRVLFVEDDDDTRQLVSIALETSGAIVEAVASVREAMDRLDDFQPDLLLSDIGLPEKDGYELMRLLKSRGRQIPSIALTAYATSEDRQRALSAGYWHHIGKPVDISELIMTVSTVATIQHEGTP
jgi:signal transduction histidine kinase